MTLGGSRVRAHISTARQRALRLPESIYFRPAYRFLPRYWFSWKRLNLHVTKLDISRMALQSDVPLAPARVGSGNRVVGHQFAIERYFDARGGRLDFEGIPLTCRLGSHCRGRREGIDGACLMQRIKQMGRHWVRVVSHVVDLNLVAFVRGQHPIISGIGRVEGGETNQDA